MNSFLPVMKFVYYLASVNCRNCILNGLRKNASTKFNNDYPAGSSLRIFVPCLARNFTFYASLCRKNSQDCSDGFNAQGKTQTKSGKVSVIDENKVELVMSFSDAEKLAKRRNLKLVQLENSKADKVKYRLEKSPQLVEASKNGQKAVKKIVVTEEIQIHDLEIKSNQMLKHLAKGFDVVCIIEIKKNNKMNGILEWLHNSKLKDYFVSSNTSKRNISLNYVANLPEKKDGQGKREEKEGSAQSSK